MSRRKNLTLTILLLLIFIDLLEACTHYCFKRSALPLAGLEVKSLGDASLFVRAVAFSPFLWGGLLAVFCIFVIWATILSKIDLSVAVPVCSFSYIFVPLVSVFFLGESISGLRWAGVFFILAGVFIVSMTSRERGGGHGPA